jgi:hypothetical protein
VNVLVKVNRHPEKCLIAGRRGNEQRCSQWKPARSGGECRRVQDMWRSMATRPPEQQFRLPHSSPSRHPIPRRSHPRPHRLGTLGLCPRHGKRQRLERPFNLRGCNLRHYLHLDVFLLAPRTTTSYPVNESSNPFHSFFAGIVYIFYWSVTCRCYVLIAVLIAVQLLSLSFVAVPVLINLTAH